jgi:hypothetical protein
MDPGMPSPVDSAVDLAYPVDLTYPVDLVPQGCPNPPDKPFQPD